MICVLSHAWRLIKSILIGLGFNVVEENPPRDIIVAGHPTVVVGDEKLNLDTEVVEASVTKLYASLHNSINESLEMVRKK